MRPYIRRVAGGLRNQGQGREYTMKMTKFALPFAAIALGTFAFIAPKSASATPEAAAAAGVDLRVAYIESSYAQYIDSGVVSGPGVKAEAVAAWVNPISDSSLLGARNNGAGNGQFYMIHTYNNHPLFGPAQVFSCNNDTALSNVTYAAEERHTIVADFGAASQSLAVDGTTVKTVSNTLSSGMTLAIFAINRDDGVVNGFCKARLYSLKIWKNGALVRDYVPARKRGVFGLWDHQNGTFHASATSTPFTGLSLDIAYIESYAKQYIDSGVVAGPGVKAEAVAAWIDPVADSSLLGARNNAAGHGQFYMIHTYNNHPLVAPAQVFSCNNDTALANVTYAAGEQHTIVADFGAASQSLAVDGTTVKTVSNTLSSGETLAIFAIKRDDGVVNAFCKARLYSLKIWKDGTLVRDYVPARNGSSVGLYDDVVGNFVGSDTDFGFLSALDIPGKPDYYAQWIESTGTQYIDSGVVAGPGVKAEAVAAWTDPVTDSTLVGARNPGSNNDGSNGAFYMISTYNGHPLYGPGQVFSCNTDTALADVAYAAGAQHTIVADFEAASQSLAVDGATVKTASNTLSSGVTLGIFAMKRDDGTVAYNSKARLYALKIWKNGDLVRDFVPGVKDGEGCLYDKVSDRCFFTVFGSFASAAGRVGPPAGTPTRPKWELSYLGSEGNSFIDTGVIGNPGVKAEATFAFTAPCFVYNSSDRTILGALQSGGVRCVLVGKDGGYTMPPLNYLTCGVDGFYKCNASDPTSAPSDANRAFLKADTTYTVTADFRSGSQTVVINGGTYSDQTVFQRSIAMSNTGYNLYALGRNNAGTPDQLSIARIYSLKIWQNGALVRNYVPVIADNGGPYLYDKVTHTFHQGATSGLWDVGEKGARYSFGTSIIVR